MSRDIVATPSPSGLVVASRVQSEVSKQLDATAMLADGINPSDRAAVDVWIETFNARPFEERDGFFGPAPDAGLNPRRCRISE
jgi:hypothetical protein